MIVTIDKKALACALGLGLATVLIAKPKTDNLHIKLSRPIDRIRSQNAIVLADELRIKEDEVYLEDSFCENVEIIPLKNRTTGHEMPTIVGHLPANYAEQLSKSGLCMGTQLDRVEALSIKIESNASLSWLGSCPHLRELKLNFDEDVDVSSIDIEVDLPCLTHLTITSTATNYYEDPKIWEQEAKELRKGSFKRLYKSDYDSAKDAYYNTETVPVAITDEMYALLKHCPNLEELNLNPISYTRDTDLSWIACCPHLQRLAMTIFFEDYWDLNGQLPDIIANLDELETLTIYTNASLLSDSDLKLIKDTLTKADIGQITYASLVAKDCFSFTKIDETSTLSPGEGDRLDYYDLPDIDTLDFSKIGIYGAGIYIDEDTIDYLESIGTTMNFDGRYTVEDMKTISKRIDKVAASILVDAGPTDEDKLISILHYILKEFHYGSTDNSIDVVETYYKDGKLYAPFHGTSLVCGNYASLLCALLERADIESYYIRNAKHAWVLAKIDGTYAYIDPTTLDSTYDKAIAKGLSPTKAFALIQNHYMYLRDPLEIELRTLKRENDDFYYGAKIPEWLDIYSPLYRKETRFKEIRLDN